jgi:hypothetical protein
VGTAVNLSSSPDSDGAGFETQLELRAHASQRSTGWVLTIDHRLAQRLAAIPCTHSSGEARHRRRRRRVVSRGGGGRGTRGSIVLHHNSKPTSSNSVLGAEEGTALGERESPA